MNNNEQDINDSTNLYNTHYNCESAVEQVYPAEIIDSTEYVNLLPEQSPDLHFDPQAEAANDAQVNTNIYALNGARRAKHNRSQERRAHKSQLTDRRSSARLCANGEIQKDRRADNRAANIGSIRQINTDNANRSENSE